VLTLDVGTSSVRAMLTDEGAGPLPLSEVKIEYRPRIEADGTAEMDPDRLVRHCLDAISGALRRVRGSDGVTAVGVSTFWHGLLGLDPHDRPSTSLILWSDTRSWRQARALAERTDPEGVRVRTGAPLHPSYWPAKLAWLRAEQPAAWQTTRRWVSLGDYLYLELFGQLGTSASMASGTGLRSLDDGTWDQPLLTCLGIESGQLPPEAEEMQDLRPEHAQRWPALARIPWLTARGDGAMANLGSDCTTPRRRALTVGTSAALRVMTSERPKLARGLWCYLVDRSRYLLGGSFSNGGNLHEWLLKNLGVHEVTLERSLRRLPPASAELTFLPLLSGERSPGFAAHSFGAIAQLTAATTATDIARAGMEGVAIQVATVDRALDESAPGAERLLASGGALTRSPGLCQVMADVIGKPLSMLPVEEASSRGAALVALDRIGARPPRMLPIRRTFRPRPGAHDSYREAYFRVQRLYDALIERRLFEDDVPAPKSSIH
jgi:gluconokinase